MKKRCLHCNSFILENEKLLDEKKELCDKCYVKICKLDKITMILELDIESKKIAFDEMIEYLENYANLTIGISGYSLKFKKL